VEKQYYVFLLCVCSLTYPSCKQHAPYCIVLSVLRGSTVFFTFSQKRHALRKNVTEHKMCALIFSAPLSKIFLIPRRIQPNVITNVRSLYRAPVIFCRISLKLKFSRHIFENYSNVKYNENQSIGIQVVPCERTQMEKRAD
jgi:hypothetical protein